MGPLLEPTGEVFGMGDGAAVGGAVGGAGGDAVVEQSMNKQMFLSLGTAPWETAKTAKIKTTLLFMFLTSNDLKYATSQKAYNVDFQKQV